MTEATENLKDRDPVASDECLSPPIRAVRTSWSLPVPKAMPLGSTLTPLLDQMAHQPISTFPAALTPWQWAEPLCPLAIALERGGLECAAQVRLIPYRFATLRDHEVVGPGEIEMTPIYDHIMSTLSQPIGEFAANRFFSLPGTIDTCAMMTVTSHLNALSTLVRDEAPMVRCGLLNELVIAYNSIKRLTQLPTRFGPSLQLRGVTRRVIGSGGGVPNGKIGCIDLTTYTRIIGGTFFFEGEYEALGPATWGAGTAVVPIKVNDLGCRWAVPYLLSFVGSEYWNQRVWYTLQCVDHLAPEEEREVNITTAPYASLSHVPGDENILIVLIDTEHRLGQHRNFAIARTRVRVPIIGQATREFNNIRLPGVRDLTDVYLGPVAEGSAPGCTQTEVGLAWEKLYDNIATPGCAEHALALVSEMSRRFPVDPLVQATHNGESIQIIIHKPVNAELVKNYYSSLISFCNTKCTPLQARTVNHAKLRLGPHRNTLAMGKHTRLGTTNTRQTGCVCHTQQKQRPTS